MSNIKLPQHDLYESIGKVIEENDVSEKLTPSQRHAREKTRPGADSEKHHTAGMGGQRKHGGYGRIKKGGDYEQGDAYGGTQAASHAHRKKKKIKGAKPQPKPGEQHDIQKRLALKKKREALAKERQKLDTEYDPEIAEAIMNRVMEKLTPAQQNLKRAYQDSTGGREGGGRAAIQKKSGGDKGSSGYRSTPDRTHGPGSHQTKGTAGDLEKKRHGRILAKQGAAGKDSNLDPTTKRTQLDLKKKLLAKKREALAKEREKLEKS